MADDSLKKCVKIDCGSIKIVICVPAASTVADVCAAAEARLGGINLGRRKIRTLALQDECQLGREDCVSDVVGDELMQAVFVEPQEGRNEGAGVSSVEVTAHSSDKHAQMAKAIPTTGKIWVRDDTEKDQEEDYNPVLPDHPEGQQPVYGHNGADQPSSDNTEYCTETVRQWFAWCCAFFCAAAICVAALLLIAISNKERSGNFSFPLSLLVLFCCCLYPAMRLCVDLSVEKLRRIREYAEHMQSEEIEMSPAGRRYAAHRGAASA